MNKFKVGDRVVTKNTILFSSYVNKAVKQKHVKMSEGATGTVICIAATGKLGIQFDNKIWKTPHVHNNACHGRGIIDYCWYIHEHHISQIQSFNLLLLL